MVFWRARYGDRDRDDREGTGPEHDCIACAAPREGTWTFSVNDYEDPFGAGPVRATLALRVPGSATVAPVTVALDAERGPAGTYALQGRVRVQVVRDPRAPGGLRSVVTRVSAFALAAQGARPGPAKAPGPRGRGAGHPAPPTVLIHPPHRRARPFPCPARCPYPNCNCAPPKTAPPPAWSTTRSATCPCSNCS